MHLTALECTVQLRIVQSFIVFVMLLAMNPCLYFVLWIDQPSSHIQDWELMLVNKFHVAI